MANLGVFAENDAPAATCGIFYRPARGWFVKTTNGITGPFATAGQAESVAESLGFDVLKMARSVIVFVVGGAGLLALFWLVATMLILAEQQGLL